MGLNVNVLKATWTAFNEDKAPRLATAIAYTTLFSIVPLFIVLIAILGAVLGANNGGHGHRAAEDALLSHIGGGAGGAAATTIRQLISASFDKPRQNIAAQVIGWITFILGATGLFTAIQDALNDVWRIHSPKGGWKHMLRARVASFGMLGVVGFLLLVSFAASAVITAVSAHFREAIPFPGAAALLNVITYIVTLVIVTLIFALLYKVLPDVDLSWRDVWPGAIFTSVLFVVGQVLISLYLTMAGVASAYGAAGSLLALLLWIYYSAMIFLIGAEFTKVRAGDVKTTVPAEIRETPERPPGVDPRTA